MHLNAVQVRKDLALVSSVAGKPKLGFEITDLIEDINRFLGYDNTTDAVIVGVGGGQSPLGYGGFAITSEHRRRVRHESSLIGKKISSVTVQSADKIQEFVRRQSVKIGIICVPKEFAQSVADELWRAACARSGILRPRICSCPKK